MTTNHETVGDVLADMALIIEQEYDGSARAVRSLQEHMADFRGRIERAHAAGAGRVPEELAGAVLSELRGWLGVDGALYQRVRAVLSAAPDPKPAPEAEPCGSAACWDPACECPNRVGCGGAPQPPAPQPAPSDAQDDPCPILAWCMDRELFDAANDGPIYPNDIVSALTEYEAALVAAAEVAHREGVRLYSAQEIRAEVQRERALAYEEGRQAAEARLARAPSDEDLRVQLADIQRKLEARGIVSMRPHIERGASLSKALRDTVEFLTAYLDGRHGPAAPIGDSNRANTTSDAPKEPRAAAAVRTLEALVYTSHGGTMWKPPIGKPPAYVTEPAPQPEPSDAPASPSPEMHGPVRMVLHCPRCHAQHIDEPDERAPGWDNPPHRSHLCHACGCIWRPADIATVGVAAIATKGKADSWPSASPQAAQGDGAWVPRDVLEAMAEIELVDVDDPNGPGYTECPACGQSAQGHWEDPPHYVRPSVPHFAHCPAEFARRLTSAQPATAKAAGDAPEGKDVRRMERVLLRCEDELRELITQADDHDLDEQAIGALETGIESMQMRRASLTAGDAEFKVGDRVLWPSASAEPYKGTVTAANYTVRLDGNETVNGAPASSLTRLTGGSHD